MRTACLAPLLLLALLTANVPAQQQSFQSADGNWLSQILNKATKPKTPTLLLPDAPARLRRDQSRESWLEKKNLGATHRR